MLIRGETRGILREGAALASHPSIPAATLPTLLLGGLLLLIGPWGPSGRFAPGHSGVAWDQENPFSAHHQARDL